MLLKVRDKDGKLFAKDILDIDFNMYVAECKSENNQHRYTVKLNNDLELDEKFDTQEAAELALDGIVTSRNQLEEELRQF